MSVRKIGPKNWAARASRYDPDGTQHQPYKSGFTTKAAAVAWERDQIAAAQASRTRSVRISQLCSNCTMNTYTS